nr:NifU family protein [Candidatus Wallbacteria bacterium]
MKEKVKKIIDKIRPMLNADGGDIELIDVVDNVVKVKLKGACH